MPSEPFIPSSKNLSMAWAEVFLKLMDQGTEELSPVIVTVTDIDEQGVAKEIPAFRQRLDQELAAHGEQRCHTVANTIFPESLWNPAAENNAKKLFERYERIWPTVQKYPLNRRGVYFRRLTAYAPKGSTSESINQLQHIIDTYKGGNHRRSALQAVLFDPTRDHTHSRQQGFPCLQQVAFTPLNRSGLSVTGFYPMQYQFERAYGNYLGLCRLGRFMARQMSLSLVQMTCIAVVTQRGNYSKSSLRHFTKDLNRIVTAVWEKA
jgi:thymidylate synthase